MLEWLGMEGLGWVVAFAILAAAAVFLVVRGRKSDVSREGERYDDALGEGQRISVLESATVDAQRRLVLVRCDDVEHLIMVGGPADVVIESDVRRSRPLQSRNGYSNDPGLRIARSAAPDIELPLKIESRAAEDFQDEIWPGDDTGAQPGVAPVIVTPAPTARDGQRGEDDRRRSSRAEPVTAPSSSRDSDVRPSMTPYVGELNPIANDDARDSRRDPEPRSRPMPQAQPIGPSRPLRPSAQPSSRSGRAFADTVDPSREARSAPEAAWPDTDSVDDEIAAAVRAEAQDRNTRGAPREQDLPDDPESEFADLADRLEEALAREVQSAAPSRGRPRSDPDDFGFDRATPDRQRPQQTAAAEPRIRAEDRVAAKRLNAVPEPEIRRDGRKPQERQDDAPVISLNARRREASDPLEDEMARLLGELTGDTNRR